MAGVGDQHRLASLDARQIDVGKVRHQIRRVMHTGFDRRQHIRVAGQRQARHDDAFAINRMLIGIGRREAGDLVTHLQIIDPVAQRSDHASHLVTQPGRQPRLGRGEVLPP
ncbi:hypothetical protein APX70_200205 [Pseudomonas syringae pv. maculicola]|uniref:Uncharacterized protein n=1 Tax=Pseudomonas syringae pv. maculicola TaxID=59511 RepID=A0A3M2ZIT4_PSEYM|nr:hypothetical protein APX70_200205 [Pseudomonas syringae pv. maculicola]